MKYDGIKNRDAARPVRRNWLSLVLLLLFLAGPALGGFFTLLQVIKNTTPGVSGLGGVTALAVSPDGTQLYAVGENDNTLVVFHRDATHDTLSFAEVHEDEVLGVFGLLGPSGVAASPDGRHVYAVAQADDTLVAFSRDATSDTLSFLAAEVKEDLVGGVVGLNGASGVAVSPDDKHVYVSARIDDALTVFSRDATSDSLSFVEAELTATLDGAAAVAVSPNGKNVYVASEISDTVSVFSRDAATGEVQLVTKLKDGFGGVDGLNGASSVAVSPDGENVYVTGRIDNAVAIFDRNSADGTLTFQTALFDGVDGIDGLALPSWVTVNPTGDRVLVAGAGDDAVALFRRTVSTGALDLLDVLFDGVDGVDGLAGVAAVVAGDDHAYAAGHDEDEIVGFHLALCEGNEASGDSDGDAFCDDVDLCLGDDLTGDSDSDGVCDDSDVCPGFSDLADGDGDGVPNGCDVCTGDDATGDSDNDGFCDDSDVCPGFPDAVDGDGDGVPDGCDVCTGDDATGDSDADGVCDNVDVCAGDDATGDGDSDGVCADLDCNDADPTNACAPIFSDGFESGNTNAWSSAVP